MGLISSMQPEGGRPTTPIAYFWNGVQSLKFTVNALVGDKVVVSASFRRRFSAVPISLQTETLAADGFIGEYAAPASAGSHPAILTLGGSEGGNSTVFLAELLASQGYPSLAIAYFAEPGLPQTLSDIPLEYCATALRWLDAQPGVDPHEVWVSGGSRGSEAALLLGVHYPNLVHGVIASSPSDVAICSIPCTGPVHRPLHGRSTASPCPTPASSTTRPQATTPRP